MLWLVPVVSNKRLNSERKQTPKMPRLASRHFEVGYESAIAELRPAEDCAQDASTVVDAAVVSPVTTIRVGVLPVALVITAHEAVPESLR